MSKVKFKYIIKLTPLGKALCAFLSVVILSCFLYTARTNDNTHNVQAKNADLLFSLSSTNILLNTSKVEQTILENSKSTSPKPVLTISFSENSSSVNTEDTEKLDELVKVLNSLDSSNIIIEGNIDSSNGSNVSEPEKQLSMNRAEVIGNYLTEKGIKPSRIILISNLGYKPLRSNTTKYGRQTNDRTDIFLRIDQ